MKHARNDYNARIQDAQQKIPKDEPVFMLRGQDMFAPMMLEIYANLVELSEEPDANIIRNTRAHAIAMRRWQKENGKKSPDMNAEDSVY